MSLPTITPKAIRKVINKAKKDGINLTNIPRSFLDESNTPAVISVADFNMLCGLDLEQFTKQERYYVEALRGAYLKDLQRSLEAKGIKEKKKANWLNRLKFILLMIAGTIFFGCEGFDGVTALFGIFNLPTVAIYIAGMAFSILSILVFYAFDLMEISHNLGVSLKSTPKLVDLYTKELESIKLLRIKLNLEFSDKATAEELEEYLQLMKVLKARRDEILRDVEVLKKSLNNPALKAIKYATALLTGVIFFSGGFFAGKTVALAIAGLFVTSISPGLAIGILVVGLLVAAASFAIYWYVERPGIENLIGRIIGLDKEKIDKITNVEENNNEKKEMEASIKNIDTRKKEIERTVELTSALEEEKRNHELDNQSNAKALSAICIEANGLKQELADLKNECQGMQSELMFHKEQQGRLVLTYARVNLELEEMRKQLKEEQEKNKRLQAELDKKGEKNNPRELAQASDDGNPVLPVFNTEGGKDIYVDLKSVTKDKSESESGIKLSDSRLSFFNTTSSQPHGQVIMPGSTLNQ
ncbi:hypothetical protein DIZ81_09315 [Legionella taurinensis]|uniref:Coiled-coil protein n=1 Tax=Legionella taurinensis TaxID=70611 RepID=A0AB38N343_9GAMM|nr:hypothetical protein [Legionella taurinensis]MDX1837772.1 hypothetical protein [Legionella taurinensis]PUT39720.1 hypothetical protein DB744_09325 [Legionella taurinensis]PUT43413.1 hypothetical protein DB746_06645 [Legionella taurinensis]PUT45859.1 hypothetical protein DB743_06640 [Legionella taurinensis]PUT47771.1 hypothetical protein DB745_07725 [Legionella taurinensis]